MSIATALLGLLGLVIFLFSVKKPKGNEPPGKYFEVNTKADFQTQLLKDHFVFHFMEVY